MEIISKSFEGFLWENANYNENQKHDLFLNENGKHIRIGTAFVECYAHRKIWEIYFENSEKIRKDVENFLPQFLRSPLEVKIYFGNETSYKLYAEQSANEVFLHTDAEVENLLPKAHEIAGKFIPKLHKNLELRYITGKDHSHIEFQNGKICEISIFGKFLAEVSAFEGNEYHIEFSDIETAEKVFKGIQEVLKIEDNENLKNIKGILKKRITLKKEINKK
jgi:hypothetical protein